MSHEEFEYSCQEGWILIRNSESGALSIFNKLAQAVLLVVNRVEHDRIVNKLLSEGVEVVGGEDARKLMARKTFSDMLNEGLHRT